MRVSLSPTAGELENRFSYHPPRTDEDRAAHRAVRDACLHAAIIIASTVPAGLEQSSALTRLEEAMFHANAGLARARG
jgi:hypothetical protein